MWKTWNNEVGSISNGSENSSSLSLGSSSSQNLGYTSRRRKLERKATSSSISSSNCSFDEGSTGRGTLPSDDECSIPNKSYFRKRALGPRENLHSNVSKLASSALQNGSCSKTQLESAEGTTEELRAEAKMWERNARKLMVDMDVLTKEFTEQSKKQANLVMELSSAYAEHDNLRKEIDSLKVMLEKSEEKHIPAEDFTHESNGKTDTQKELENEIRYQQQSNENLALQLERSQESNTKLVSILQEMEETIEQQRAEIENLLTLQLKLDYNGRKTDGEINNTGDLSCKLHSLLESEKALQVNVQILEKSLEEKNRDLEFERNQTIHSLVNIEREYKYQLSLKGQEIAKLEAELLKDQTKAHDGVIDVEGNNKDRNASLLKEIEELREKMMELERDCDELTEENLDLLLKLKESKDSCVGRSVSSTPTSTKPQSTYIDPEFVMIEDERDGNDFVPNGTSDEKSSTTKGFEWFSELMRQLEIITQKIKTPWYNVAPEASDNLGCHLSDLINVNNTDGCNSDSYVEAVGHYLSVLDKLLETKISECEQKLRRSELEAQEKISMIEESQTKLDGYLVMVKEFDKLKNKIDNDNENLQLLLANRTSESSELQADLLRRNQQCDSLMQHEKELQVEVTNLQEKNEELEEKLSIAKEESDKTLRDMDSMRVSLATLASSMDSHLSAKLVLEQKLSNLQKEKHKLENQLSGVKEEKLLFGEEISASQFQLQRLVAERETYKLRLESSRDVINSLQNDVRKCEIEIYAQRSNVEQYVRDIQKQYEESQSECSLLKAENRNLEISAMNLIEENMTLRTSNTESSEKKCELDQCCSRMEVLLNDYQRHFLDCSRKVDNLEKGISTIHETFTLGEKSLNLEIEALHEENRKDIERLGILGNLLYQMSEEQKVLRQEVDDLKKKVSLMNEEKENMALEASCTLSSVFSDKIKLEQDLHSAHEKASNAETELDSLRLGTTSHIEGLIIELDTAKQCTESLVSEHERKLLTNYRIYEEKVKIAVKDLELKLTAAEYERTQLAEEVTDIKTQLQHATEHQDEITVLNKELTVCKFEKEKIEAMLQSLSQSHEDLMAKNQTYVEKISSMELVAADYEICRQKVVSLEQKIMDLEVDLAANGDLRSKFRGIKKENEQYQHKMHDLEQEKDDLEMRAQELQESLRLMEEKQSHFQKGDNEYTSNGASRCTTKKGHEMEIMFLQNELQNSQDAKMYKNQLQRFWSEGCTHVITTNNSAVCGDEDLEEMYERSKSPIETELKELQDRYFQMSLKYAEVEAQREDLVMQLKASKSTKGWFS